MPNKLYPEVVPGATIKVYQKIKEITPKGEEKERIQIFEGIVLARRGSGVSENITARKESYGIGVEKIFPLALPTIEKIEVVKRMKTRRAKLHYLKTYKKKIKEYKK